MLKLTNKLRDKGYSVEYDYRGRKFNKQLEKAIKTAKNAIILGEDEIKSNTITVKDLASATQKTISQDKFLEEV